MDQPKSSQVPVHVKLEEKLADDEQMPLWARRGIVDSTGRSFCLAGRKAS